MQVVSEKLSQHVIDNYDKFVAGVDEVTQVEAHLQAAHVTAKCARGALALALREVGVCVCGGGGVGCVGERGRGGWGLVCMHIE